MFEKLPLELIDIILEYEGSIKKRNGVYMTQIPKTDSRYELLKNLPIDSLNNMRIMKELDDLQSLANEEVHNLEYWDEDLYMDILMDIIVKYCELFQHINEFDHNLNLDFGMWFSIDNVSHLWSGFYDYENE